MTTHGDDPGDAPADALPAGLSAVWRTTARLPVPHEPWATRLRRRERRAARRLALWTTVEIALTVGAFAWLRHVEPPVSRRAAALWAIAAVHTAIIWVLVLWLRRGLWAPLSDGSDAYLQALRRRAERRRAEVAWIARLLLVETVLWLAWLGAGVAGVTPASEAHRTPESAALWGAAGLAVAAGLLVVCWRRAGRDLKDAAERERELVEFTA